MRDHAEVGIAAIADVDGFEPALLRWQFPEPVDEVGGGPVCGLVRFPRAEHVAEQGAAGATGVVVTQRTARVSMAVTTT